MDYAKLQCAPLDYIKYDERSVATSNKIRAHLEEVAALIRLELLDTPPYPEYPEIVLFDGDTKAYQTAVGKYHEANALISGACLALNSYKTEALKAVELTYMWCGKAIRNHQALRNGGAEDVPERTTDQ
jgi:hypothetical protein